MRRLSLLPQPFPGMARMFPVLSRFEYGAYKAGTNPKLDHALSKIDGINQFLMQGINESFSYEESLEQLRRILR